MEGNDASELYAQVPGLALTGAIALVPDRDDDGRAELALTITDVRSGKPGEPGEALLILNPSDLTLHQRSPIPLSGAMGPAWEVRDLGDVTGDGVSDTIVTVINYCAFLFSGATGEEFRRHPWWDGYMYSDGSSLDVFDLDGDGISEYLIGANEDDMDCDRGYARVFSGADGTLLRNLSFDYRRDFDTCSVDVDTCAIGDVDGDGWVDVVVHMPRLEEARVLSGADFSTLVSVKIPAPGPK